MAAPRISTGPGPTRPTTTRSISLHGWRSESVGLATRTGDLYMTRAVREKVLWRRILLSAFVWIALSGVAPIASADEIVKLKTELAGANEVPPSGSPGTGHA